MSRMRGAFFGLLAVAGVPAAQAADPPAQRPPNSDWTLTLGVEARVLPSFEGSGGSMLRPFPLIDIRRAGTPWQFRSARDGASVGVLETGSFRLGPTVKLKLPRRERDDGNLRGLGDIAWAPEFGGFAEYWPQPWLRTRAELRQGFGGHHGVVSDITADLVAAVTPLLTLSAGPRLTLTSRSASAPYLGITPAQSAASGLPAFEASAGLHSIGAGAQARYEWSPQWAGYFFVEYERLTGNAADSPLVTLRGSRDQVSTGIGVSYSFNMRGLW